MKTHRYLAIIGSAALAIGLATGCASFKPLTDAVNAWAASQTNDAPAIVFPSDSPAARPLACTFIRGAMVTPMFVYLDSGQVKSQSAALKSAGFNAVVSLVDLQSGRSYIFPGRSPTALAAQTRANIEHVLNAGLTPILIVRNDWAARTRTGVIPSIGGQPATSEAFYAANLLENDKVFLRSLADLFPYVHFQLSIEPDVPESALYALRLAEDLRAAGFRGRILLNPTVEAMYAHQSILPALSAAGCEFARSWHDAAPSPDNVWSTDGRTAINAGNAQSVIAALKASGKEYILWSQELSNAPNGIPAGYLSAAPVTPPVTPPTSEPEGDQTFLWKPISESRQGRACAIIPAKLGKLSVRINGSGAHVAEVTGPANGNRWHYFLKQTGSAYGRNVSVEALDASGALKRKWVVPDGGVRWGSN
jgi:hypothetical protein